MKAGRPTCCPQGFKEAPLNPTLVPTPPCLPSIEHTINTQLTNISLRDEDVNYWKKKINSNNNLPPLRSRGEREGGG